MCFLTHIHGKEFQTLPELNNVDFTTVRQKQEGKDSREQEEEKKMAAGQRSKQKKRKEKKICFFNLHSSPLPPRVENCWKVFLEFSSLVAKWKGWPWAALFPHMSFIFSICPSPASPSPHHWIHTFPPVSWLVLCPSDRSSLSYLGRYDCWAAAGLMPAQTPTLAADKHPAQLPTGSTSSKSQA